MLPGAGWINTDPKRKPDITVDAPIKAHHATFPDKNGNFQQDPGEDRRAWEVAATAVKKDARVFVLADSDAFDDEALPAGANQLMALDVAHWLMGDEAYTGLTSTEADVPISHTRKQDVIWFYGTIFLAPVLVILAGIGVTRAPAAPRAPSTPASNGRSSVVTGRSAAVQGGLAALGLLAAHLTWQRDPERAPGAATVIDASKSDVALVHYADNNTIVDFRRGHGDNDAPVWIHIVKGEGALRHKDRRQGQEERQGRRQAETRRTRPKRRTRRATCAGPTNPASWSTTSRRSSRRARSASWTPPS